MISTRLYHRISRRFNLISYQNSITCDNRLVICLLINLFFFFTSVRRPIAMKKECSQREKGSKDSLADRSPPGVVIVIVFN